MAGYNEGLEVNSIISLGCGRHYSAVRNEIGTGQWISIFGFDLDETTISVIPEKNVDRLCIQRQRSCPHGLICP